MTEQHLQDSILRTALQLQRLSAHEEAEAEAILRELERDLRTLLNSQTLSAANRREVEALIREAEKAIQARYTAVAGSLDTRGLFVMVSERTLETLSIISQSVVAVTPERLASLADKVLIDGSPAKAWWSKQAEDTAFKFAAQVRQGVINGETNERIVQRIVGKGGEPGGMTIARRNARALVHSSVMTAANDARLATFRKNSAFIAGVRWLATLDSHTCVTCANLDGQSWDLDGARRKGSSFDYRSPPAHWSCRCVLSPIPKGEPDSGPAFGDRVSSAGPVSASTRFADFLKRQSPAFIEKVLGKERAELYLAGKLSLRDLVSGTGRPLTLAELRP